MKLSETVIKDKYCVVTFKIADGVAFETDGEFISIADVDIVPDILSMTREKGGLTRCTLSYMAHWVKDKFVDDHGVGNALTQLQAFGAIVDLEDVPLESLPV